MPRGGKRLGAGRKPLAVKRLTEKQLMDEWIKRDLEDYYNNLRALAMGEILVQKADERTRSKKRIYRVPPDRAANEYLINRLLGRPTEPVELSGEQDTLLGVVLLPSPGNLVKSDDD